MARTGSDGSAARNDEGAADQRTAGNGTTGQGARHRTRDQAFAFWIEHRHQEQAHVRAADETSVNAQRHGWAAHGWATNGAGWAGQRTRAAGTWTRRSWWSRVATGWARPSKTWWTAKFLNNSILDMSESFACR